jgi:protein SMG6
MLSPSTPAFSSLRSFRPGWLAALGDLVRYRMAVAATVTNNQLKSSLLTTDAVSKAAAASEDDEPNSQKRVANERQVLF